MRTSPAGRFLSTKNTKGREGTYTFVNFVSFVDAFGCGGAALCLIAEAEMALMELSPFKRADTKQRDERHEQPRLHWRAMLVPASALIAFGLWEAIIRLGGYPAFILPTPGRVWARGVTAIADGTLLRHTSVTLGELLAGLALGLVVAWTLGYLLAKSPALERLLAPYLVASQSVPVVAIAPLLVIWFGAEMTSKVLICALIVFFPVLINTVVGIRSVETELRDLMRSLKATRWQTFAKLEVPAALPVLLGGLKVGATLSVIGAVVGEFVGSDSGLGFLINAGRGLYDTTLMFVAIATLVVIALTLYGLVALLERMLLAWRK